MNEVTFIYALCEPDTGTIRYIGKADNPDDRLLKHITNLNRERNHKANWIRSLLTKGQRPTVQIIDTVLRSEWKAAEAAYIEFYREQGFKLVNNTRGGEGFASGRDHPRCWRGKQMSEEHRRKLSNALKGRRKSPEHAAKVGAAHRGKKHSEEAIQRMRVAHAGTVISQETRLKMSEARRGRPNTGHFSKGEKHPSFGRPLSAEHRAKISASRIGELNPMSAANRRRRLSQQPK
jgi:GIY-YIG catalytic domain/NUMOD3 motif